MGLSRRNILTGALTLGFSVSFDLASDASEITLGKASSFLTDKPRVLTFAGNRLLVTRLSRTKISVLQAVCPNDRTALQAKDVKAGKVTCPSDKSVYAVSDGKVLAGPSPQPLSKIANRVSDGFLIASLVSKTPTASQPQISIPSDAICKVSDVPVGGGLRVPSQIGVLAVTQPTIGSIRVFYATCTHAGCQISEFKGPTLVCGCHAAEFAISDGAAVAGPARLPLKILKHEVVDGEVFLRSL